MLVLAALAAIAATIIFQLLVAHFDAKKRKLVRAVLNHPSVRGA